MKTFEQWLEAIDLQSPAAKDKLQGIESQLDSQIQALQTQLRALYEKKKRILMGVGGGYVPNYDKYSGGDLVGPDEYKQYKQQSAFPERSRNSRVQSAQDDLKQYFGGDQKAYSVARMMFKLEPGRHQLPPEVTPQQAQAIVAYLKSKDSYKNNVEDYPDMVRYDQKSHSIYMDDPYDI